MECGKPTKAGAPCKARRPSNYHFGCKQHATADEQHYGDLILAAYLEGCRVGERTAQAMEADEVARLRRRVAELEGQRRRLTDHDGAQIVQCGRYSYRWTGATPLAVGDRVWLPENYVSRAQRGPGAYPAMVTALGTDYTGALSTVVRRAEPAEGAA